MKKGTTPTHTFELPEAVVNTIRDVEITYSQNRRVILQKDMYDCTIEGNIISVTLTQADTFKFMDDVNVEIQVRVLDDAENVFASNIMCVSCERCLSDEVLL